jgi:hypothetical protein
MKSQIYKKLALVAMLVSMVFVVTDVTAKKPGTSPPADDPVFTAHSLDPIIVPIDSHSLDHDWQIVFRHQDIDLYQFKGLWDTLPGLCEHDPLQGIMVLKPKSKKIPVVARLEYWFQDELVSGETVTHLFFMEGVFDEQDNWPPSDTDPVTTLTFNYWEVAAENKWAQRQDCAGEFSGSGGPWKITVSRK